MRLSEYYKLAKIPDPPAWAKEIEMPSKCFDHQLGDLQHIASLTRCGLFNDPGLGKTRPLQAYALWLVTLGNKVVVTMPPGLMIQFKQSLLTTFKGCEKYVTSAILAGTPAARNKLTDSWDRDRWPDILIVSYDMFVKYHLTMIGKSYSCVIVDEAQAVKTPGTKIHRAVKFFAGDNDEHSNGVVLCTGTPIETKPEDAYGFFAICMPNRYGSFKAFEQLHIDKVSVPKYDYSFSPPRIVGRFEKILGYKNLDYLNHGLKSLGRRVKREDAFDLPPRIITEIPISLSSEHQELYDTIVNERLIEIGDRMIDMTTASALYQAMQRAIMCPESYCEKPPNNAVVAQIDTLLTSLEGRKVVIYCWYRESIEKLKAYYSKLNPAVLYGSITNKEPEKQKFLNDDSCRLLIANPKSGGVGVDGLQTVSSHIIFAEMMPFVGTFQQSVARVHRKGQKEASVNIYVLVPEKTIAVKLRNNLVKKDQLQEEIMQDKRTILQDLMGKEGIQGSLDDIF